MRCENRKRKKCLKNIFTKCEENEITMTANAFTKAERKKTSETTTATLFLSFLLHGNQRIETMKRRKQVFMNEAREMEKFSLKCFKREWKWLKKSISCNIKQRALMVMKEESERVKPFSCRWREEIFQFLAFQTQRPWKGMEGERMPKTKFQSTKSFFNITQTIKIAKQNINNV